MTPKKLPISVTIITKNEADRIVETIARVFEWVDEVIVVDSGSEDLTVELASHAGAKVFKNPWQGYGQQKRFAEDKANNDWILNIDADEKVEKSLKTAIIELFEQPHNLLDGYRLSIFDQFLITKKISSYKPYQPVRLYNKNVGRYRDSSVHDRVVMPKNARIGILKGKIAHQSVRSFRQRISKMNDYTDAQVLDMAKKGRQISKARIILELPISFTICYVIRGYWKDGFMGFVYATNFAYSRFLRAIKLYEVLNQQ